MLLLDGTSLHLVLFLFFRTVDLVGSSAGRVERCQEEGPHASCGAFGPVRSVQRWPACGLCWGCVQPRAGWSTWLTLSCVMVSRGGSDGVRTDIYGL